MGDQKETINTIVDFAAPIDKHNSSNAHTKLKYMVATLTAAVAILLFVLGLFYVWNSQMLDIIQRQASIIEGAEEMINKILDRERDNSWPGLFMRQIGEYTESAVLGYGSSVASKVLSFF